MSVLEFAKQDENIALTKIETQPFGTNAYILVCRKTQESVLIDAPGDEEKIADKLGSTKLKFILITHSHFDHTGALQAIKEKFKAKVIAHSADSPQLPLAPEVFGEDGNSIFFGEIEVKALYTPGHTPGSLCFLYKEYLFSGDTLFPGGPGKTGSPGDFQTILKHLEQKVFCLPDKTIVFPGHGKTTLLGKEKDEYASFSSRKHSVDLCGDVLWLSS